MPEGSIARCARCGQRNRLEVAAGGAPHCARCGAPLPWLVDVSAADFAAAVERSPLPVLVDFWAPWCGPCRMIAPAVEQLANDLAGKLKVAKVDTDREPALGSRFQIRGIPTLALFQGGREEDRVTGALTGPALRAWVDARLARAGVSGARPRPCRGSAACRGA
jgi:thioredoxin 2